MGVGALSVRVLARGLDLLQPVGDGLFQGVDEPLHQVLPQARVLDPVGLDEALVDTQEAWTAAWRSSAKRFSRRSAWASVSRPAPVRRVHLEPVQWFV